MDAGQLQFILEELRFSAALPAEAVAQLAAAAELVRVAAGEVVFREGTANDNLYLVRSGRLAVEMRVPGRGAVRILTVGPGEMAGWSAMLALGKMTATAIAMEDSQLVVAPVARLREISEATPQFGYRLMEQIAIVISQRLVATRLQLLDLFAETAPAIPPHRSKQDGSEKDAGGKDGAGKDQGDG